MKILFILILCFYINVEAQCKSNKSIYGNAISVLYEKLLKDEVLEKTDTLYLILDEKANLNKEQDKISKNISFHCCPRKSVNISKSNNLIVTHQN